MKKTLLVLLSFLLFTTAFSQALKPIPQKVSDAKASGRSFVMYDLFTVDKSVEKKSLYEQAARDITVMQLKKSELQRIVSEKPAALEMSVPFEGKTLTLELVKNEIFADGFSVNTDKGVVAYTSGVYYHGIVKGDEKSVVAISFFNDDVMGVASQGNVGNIVLGKVKNAQDFVIYNDTKLVGENPFSCGVDTLPENKSTSSAISFDPKMLENNKMTTNCVRIYFEVGSGLYSLNGSNTTTVTNWVTGMFNNIKTLYNNDNISVSMSELFIWTTTDPYPSPSAGSTLLAAFRSGRPTFNGDIGQLIKNPAVTSIAYLNTLCTGSNHSFAAVNLSYQQVPTYSWNIMAMTHEMGHSLSSPHTHACFWNGDCTQIDGCGPASGNPDPNNGNCTAGTLPTNGGTIMSYCHLVSSVGVNFTKGFGDQPAALIRNTVNSKACLSGDCTTKYATNVTNLVASNVTTTNATFTITDNVGTSWRYRVLKFDGTVVTSAITTNKVVNLTTLEPGTYYKIQVSNPFTGETSYERSIMIFTDADWCSGNYLFTDTGGLTAGYEEGQLYTKTFYPATAGDKVSLTFTEFDLGDGDYINVFDGPSVASTRFPHGTQVTGSTVPAPYIATNAQGAVTVRFLSNTCGVGQGWKANIECITLGTSESALNSAVSVSPNPTKGNITITAPSTIISYEITDASGRKFAQSSKVNAKVQNVDLSKNAAGVYLVTVKTDRETVTKKVIKY